MKIEKKVLSEYFEKILTGEKTFELRLADWECEKGDTLVLREIDSERNYTGREIEKEVAYVLKTKDVKLFSEEDIKKYGYQIISVAGDDMSDKTYDKEIEICKKHYQSKKGCAWGRCENCGVLPLLHKLHKKRLAESEEDVDILKNSIFKN